jgi:hypothetical protein
MARRQGTTDSMSITAGITAAKASLDLTKVLMDLLNRPNIDPVDVRGKVHELLIHLVNAQVALGEAQVEISELHHQLDNRQELKAIQEDLEIEPDGQYYYRASERTANKHIPYCPVCWGDKAELVPLTVLAEGTAFTCSIHKGQYFTKAYIEALKASQNRQPPRRFRNL